MLIKNEDGTFLGGPADVMCILKLPQGTYHVTFLEEHPLPGVPEPLETASMIRLKSKMHHTQGSPTLEGAQEHLKELRLTIAIPDDNVVADTPIEVSDPVSVWIVPNWLRKDISLKDALLA